mgnify:CR=1 FL=1
MTLKPKQTEAISYLLLHKSIKETAKKLKVTRMSLYRWMIMPEFQEEMKKRAKAMMDTGFALAMSSTLQWHESVTKGMRSKDESISLRACSIYTPVMCKHIPTNVQVDGASFLDFAQDMEAGDAKDSPEKSDG